MTKLTRLLGKLAVAAVIWLVLLSFWNQNSLTYKCFLCPLPFWGLVAFGAYSASVVLYRTLTFNDCPDAAKELLEQIDLAKTDLRKKGLKF